MAKTLDGVLIKKPHQKENFTKEELQSLQNVQILLMVHSTL